MNTVNKDEILELTSAVHYRPSVSIILTFDTKMGLTKELRHLLKTATDKAEKKLLENYAPDRSLPVIQKLRSMINNLKFDKSKKSIAIFVSPILEKVIYLDIPVEEKITIDESFEVRDLIYAKALSYRYLLLVLSINESSIFLGNNHSIEKLDSDMPQSANAFKNDIAEKVANFSDTAERKEIVMEKFLRSVDTSLEKILHEYKLPVFVLGTERIAGHFKHLTKNSTAVKSYVHGNFAESNHEHIIKVVAPYITAWQKEKQKAVLNLLQEASGKKKLAEGIRDVWEEASNHNGRLLVVEKNYTFAAYQGSSATVIGNAADLSVNAGNIKDAVDGIIEMVLANGGEIEFAEKDSLKEYRHIALVKFY
ncbi:MAG: hypothetical protein IPO83_14645 [Chitinophagaceae bacterium]|nr:hypothetical protein [Chitinophagaceae bacterium]